MSMKTFIALSSICLLVASYACAAPVVGDAAPEVNATEWYNTDKPVALADLDGIVIVEFWATWCPPCVASIPHLQKLHETYAEKGVTVIALTNEDPSDDLAQFIKDHGMTYIVGAGSTTARAYGVRGIPAAFIVHEGEIVWQGHPMSGMDEALKEALQAHKAAQEDAPAEAETEDVPEDTQAHGCSGTCVCGACGDAA